MTYNKLKKVVNAFIEQLKRGVTEVYLDIDGIEYRHFLTYVKKETSLICDTETEYKCVLTCRDEILQKNITFRMRDVARYGANNTLFDSQKGQYKQYMSYIHTLDSDQLSNLCARINVKNKSELSNYIKRCIAVVSGNNFIKWYFYDTYQINIENDIDSLKEIWYKHLNISKVKALAYLRDELKLSKADFEKKSITDVIAMVDDLNINTELERIKSIDELLDYWPNILLPSPVFVGSSVLRLHPRFICN